MRVKVEVEASQGNQVVMINLEVDSVDVLYNLWAAVGGLFTYERYIRKTLEAMGEE